jgi:O-antigen ligase
VLWIAMFLVVASQNRGGMLAVFCSLVVTCWFLSPRRWIPLVLPGTLLVGMLIAFGVQFQVGGSRVISPQQVFHNALSVLGVDDRLELSATREWRLQWWTKVVDYTVHGDHFWGGKGFGINLARDDGYDTSGAFPLRSPHNGHVTILARTGVPGFALWLVLQGTLLVALARAAIWARRRGGVQRAATHAWVLAYLVAFLVNMSFDVFLEGPQGGIWFWCVVGLAIALVEVERRERRQAAMVAVKSRRWS